ncbi:MAG: hypothetical protein J6X48_11065, partial [Lachnospiraceae bacterium]|nr:hypothetical protein [Lachnospiraceae bacterium]
KTIAELADWYKARKLPPYETTRYFIGINYKEHRAFGIYEENGEFIVYKNKDDGSRAIRYQGKDEAYAVNELYLKLKSEILNQKARNASGHKSTGYSTSHRRSHFDGGIIKGIIAVILGIIFLGNLNRLMYPVLASGATGILVYILMKRILGMKGDAYDGAPKGKKFLLWTAVVCLSLFVFSVVAKADSPKYYNYDGNTYVSYRGENYYYNNDWDDYYYIDALPVEIQTNPADYEFNWADDNWDYSYDFYDSDTYDEQYSSSDDSDSSSWDWSSDSDYDWDSGSDWDSGGSDWGSDW